MGYLTGTWNAFYFVLKMKSRHLTLHYTLLQLLDSYP